MDPVVKPRGDTVDSRLRNKAALRE
ncbi:MAG: hypothetical protein ACEY3D_09840 [Rickettsia sp.]